jgi:hypothetical protein
MPLVFGGLRQSYPPSILIQKSDPTKGQGWNKLENVPTTAMTVGADSNRRVTNVTSLSSDASRSTGGSAHVSMTGNRQASRMRPRGSTNACSACPGSAISRDGHRCNSRRPRARRAPQHRCGLGEVFSRRRARSFSNARSTTRCGKDGLSVLDAPCSTRLSGSPAAP